MTSPVNPGLKRRMDALKRWCKEKYGIEIRITSIFRSSKEQNRLYARGRTTSGSICTNAKGWQSWHNVGRAFDICFFDGKKNVYSGPYAQWKIVSDKAKELGLVWGGDWRIKTRTKSGKIYYWSDKPHFQYEYDNTGTKHSLAYYVEKFQKGLET